MEPFYCISFPYSDLLESLRSKVVNLHILFSTLRSLDKKRRTNFFPLHFFRSVESQPTTPVFFYSHVQKSFV